MYYKVGKWYKQDYLANIPRECLIIGRAVCRNERWPKRALRDNGL
jgi:hypothetical protein